MEGKSIIFISHKMREVLHISDRVTILRAGEPVIALHAVDYHKQSKHSGLNGVTLQVGRCKILGVAGVNGTFGGESA